MDSGVVFIQKSRDRWLAYSQPVDIVQSRDISGVLPALEKVEKAVDAGLYAAGYIAYEAAPAFDAALSVNEPGNMPLIWFGLYEEVHEVQTIPDCEDSYSAGEWKPNVSEEEYMDALKRIKAYIKAGDTYQVNYTIRLRTRFYGYPYGCFADLCKAQNGRNCAYLDTGDHVVCSASPELFLAVKGQSLKSCPMKGTAPRGLTWIEDMIAARKLHDSEKDRAENIMIVDMIRNDLGRIAEPGSVHVTGKFDIERYPTVLQMTSTVRARSSRPIAEILKAMFPCSSITGAPKVRTMEIIRELEPEPRGVYTGAIGCLSPGRKALFNVAIRTVILDTRSGLAEYGVGGGIVWDSIGDSEYSECLQKAKVLTAKTPDFCLLETMLWTSEDGYFILHEHLERLLHSAIYFGIDISGNQLTKRLMKFGAGLKGDRCRIRLLVDREGNITLASEELAGEDDDRIYRLRIASNPIDMTDRFLHHKTTNRAVYEDAKKHCHDCDDVVLFNERGEVTETTIANIVAVIGGRKITPLAGCGLLRGTMRSYLLKKGAVEEGILTLVDLKHADELFLINSVRRWMKAEILWE